MLFSKLENVQTVRLISGHLESQITHQAKTKPSPGGEKGSACNVKQI